MDDCKHEDLHYYTFQTNPKNAEAPMFHTVRCKKCNHLIGVFPIERNVALLQTMQRDFAELTKVLYKIEAAILKQK